MVTDTPLARETDYGRVDDHSSAIRAPGDKRRTFNRVPDYPATGVPLVSRKLDGRNHHRLQLRVGFHRTAQCGAGHQHGGRY